MDSCTIDDRGWRIASSLCGHLLWWYEQLCAECRALRCVFSASLKKRERLRCGILRCVFLFMYTPSKLTLHPVSELFVFCVKNYNLVKKIYIYIYFFSSLPPSFYEQKHLRATFGKSGKFLLAIADRRILREHCSIVSKTRRQCFIQQLRNGEPEYTPHPSHPSNDPC